MNMLPNELMGWYNTIKKFNEIQSKNMNTEETDKDSIVMSLKDLGLEELNKQYREDYKNAQC